MKLKCGCKIIDTGHYHDMITCYYRSGDSFEVPELDCGKEEQRIWFCPIHYRAEEMHNILKDQEDLSNETKKNGAKPFSLLTRARILNKQRKVVLDAIEKTS